MGFGNDFAGDLHEKIEQLQAENERLTDDFNYAHEKKKELQAELDKVKAELREIQNEITN